MRTFLSEIRANAKKILFWLIIVLLLGPVISNVYAQSQTPTPDVISISSDGSVYAVEQDEQHIYVGGNFESLEINNISLQQEKYAVISVQSKKLLPKQHILDGDVRDIQLDRGNVYVVGTFKKVDDNARSYFAVFSADNNELLDKQLQLDGPVHAIVIRKNILYLGGAFTKINGQERLHIASLNIDRGDITDWNPNITETVEAMELKDDTLLVTAETPIDDTSLRVVTYTVNPETTVIVTAKEEVVSVTPTPIVEPSEASPSTEQTGLMVDQDALGFRIPSLSDILTFAIRGFFAIAGLAALFFLLLGAFAWVTSGGDKDAISAARDKIQAAIVGLIMMVVVLAIIWTLEQVVFKRRICIGLSCPVTIPSLIEPI